MEKQKRGLKNMNDSQALAHLQKIEDLLTFLVKKNLRDFFEKELKDKRTKQIYDMAGQYTSREAASKLKCSHVTIANTWKQWEQDGLLIKAGKSYRKLI